MPAAVGALGLAAMLPYLYARQFRLVLGDADPFVLDFSYFYRAAARFVADPLTLYAGLHEYIYPPPSVLAFVPWLALPGGVAYVTFAVLSLPVLGVAVWLALGLYERAFEEQLAPALKASLVLVALGSGPAFQNVKYGQVGALVLLAGVLFLRWSGGRRLWAAGLALGAGFWLKLYPLVLAPLGLPRPRGRALAGLALGLLGPPLALLAVVPPALYRHYVAVVLPYWSDATDPFVLNGSVVGVLTRLEAPTAALLISRVEAVSAFTRVVNAATAVGLLGGLHAAVLARRLRPEVAGMALLAAAPAVSGLGWEHTYVLALPLALFTLVAARRRSAAARALVATAVLALMVPTPPHAAQELLVARAPRVVLDLLYARPLLLTLGLMAAVVGWTWGRPGLLGAGARAGTDAVRGPGPTPP